MRKREERKKKWLFLVFHRRAMVALMILAQIAFLALAITAWARRPGVALGMCATAMQLGAEGELIRNITLFAVLIYELFGPLMTRQALMSAGEITPVSDEVKMRRQTKLEMANKDTIVDFSHNPVQTIHHYQWHTKTVKSDSPYPRDPAQDVATL